MKSVRFNMIPTMSVTGTQVSPAMAAALAGNKPWHRAEGGVMAPLPKPKAPKQPKPVARVGPLPVVGAANNNTTSLMDQVLQRLKPDTAVAVLNDLANRSSPFSQLPVPKMRPATNKNAKKPANKLAKTTKKKAAKPKKKAVTKTMQPKTLHLVISLGRPTAAKKKKQQKAKS
jgi:hypothetical protein